MLKADGLGRAFNGVFNFTFIGNQGIAGLYYPPPQDYIQICPQKATTANGSYLDVLIHEVGHRFEFNCGNRIPTGETKTLSQRIVDRYNAALANTRLNLFPSPYSRTNSLEYWAECFRFHYTGTLAQTHPKLNQWVTLSISQYKSVPVFPRRNAR